MTSEDLRPACELAFVVAREGFESPDAIEPPVVMRSFLYVEELPRRAIAAAQQAIEENPEFRRRVALRADEDSVGRAGVLWLQRPNGWAQEFEHGSGSIFGGQVDDYADDGLEMPFDSEQAADLAPVGLDDELPPADDLDEPDDATATSEHETLDELVEHPAVDPSDYSAEYPAEDPADYPAEYVDDPSEVVELVPAQPPMPDIDPGYGPEPTPAVPSAEHSSADQGSDVTSTEHTDHSTNDSQYFTSPDVDGLVENDPEADALESELSSLRGLVERLASEREMVESSVPQVDGDPVVEVAERSPQVSSIDFGLESQQALRTDLDTVRHELSLTQSDLTVVRQEREEAQRLHSDALKRQVQLEKELATIREQRADLDKELTTARASVISFEERIGRLESQLEEADRERKSVRSQLEALTVERNEMRDDQAVLRAERNELKSKVDEIVSKTGGVDIVELVETRKAVDAELQTTSRELARMLGQAEHYESQIRTLSADVASLRGERMDLRSRLGESETGREAVTTQYEALKIDAERTAAELGVQRAERDGLQTQLGELQSSLSEVLAEQAESRQRNDSDRQALNEIRVERDVLVARLQDLEQADSDNQTKLTDLVAERDQLLVEQNAISDERAQLRANLDQVSAERVDQDQQLQEQKERLSKLSTELQMERRQREELANRLLELDEEAAQRAAVASSLAAEREELAAAILQLEERQENAAQYRRERDDLAAELAQTKRQTEELIERLRAEAQEATDELQSSETSRDDLTEQVAQATRQVEELEQQLVEIEVERARLSEAQDGAGNRIAELESLVDGRATEIDELKGKVVAAEEEADDAKGALGVKQQELETVLGTRSVDATEIEKLKGDLADALVRANEATKLEAAAEVSQGEIDSLNQELTASKATIDSLEERLSESASASADVESLQQRLTESKAESAAEMESLRQRLAASTAEAESLRHELAAARVEVESAAADLTAVQAKTDDDAKADNLDDMAAEVRGVLRSPSVLDDNDQADSPPTPAAPGAPVDAPFPGPGGVFFDQPSAPTEPDRAPAGDGDKSDTRQSTEEHEMVPASAFDDPNLEPGGSIDGVAARAGEPPSVFNGGNQGDEDEHDLDAVSALIAQKVSSFADDDLGFGGVDADSRSTDFGAGAGPSLESIGPQAPSILGDSGRPSDRPDLAVRRPGGPKRRRIEIPEDVGDDGVAVARFVVSSPDVVLLVDGDSVAEMGWPSLPVPKRRDALVTYLADLSAKSGAAPDVVFDGRIGGEDEPLPASRAVRIRLSTPPGEPTAALDELVDAYPEQWPIALVTDDPALSSSADERGAAVLNNSQLLDLFIFD